MLEHGSVMYFNAPKLRILADDGQEFKLEWVFKNYPEEHCRLLSHHCGIQKGEPLTFSKDGEKIVDVRFDNLADADPAQEEVSKIVKIITDSTAFAQRVCGCWIHVGGLDVVNENGQAENWYGSFEVGMVLTHQIRIGSNRNVTATNIRILSNHDQVGE